MVTAQDTPYPPPQRHTTGQSPNRRRRASTAVPALVILATMAATPAWANTQQVATPPGQITTQPLPPEPATPAGTSIWTRSFYKLLTYETMANASDVVILSALSGGIGSVGAGFLGANVATAAAAYYTHEIAWALFGPPPEDHTALVTGAKATTYRFVSVGRSFTLAYFLAGGADIATSFALIGNIADTVIYVGNEWAWNVFSPPTGAPMGGAMAAPARQP